MKTFHIPLVDRMLCIYNGKDDWDSFMRAALKTGAQGASFDAECPGKGAGRSFGYRVWVWDISNRASLIHELSHFLDWLLDSLCSTDTEFRAYCTAWVIETVLAWREKHGK